MICPDINLLLYAINDAFPQHRDSKTWWDATLSGSVPVGLGHVVILGFIRLATNRKVFPHPLSIEQAVAVVDGWLAQPCVQWIAPVESHWDTLKSMLLGGSFGANLTTDAHIAALAADYGATVYSNDTDFARFSGVEVVNPLL